MDEAAFIISEVEESPEMKVLWKNYQETFDYAEGINWEEIMKTVKEVYTRIGIDI